MTPLVLIVGRLSDTADRVRGPAFAGGQSYFLGVERAGGVPLMLPPIPSLLPRLDSIIDRVDAVILHGGGDVDPHRYGQEPTAEKLYGIVAEHDEVELAVVAATLAADKPMLAICRGMQVLNVALRGTLRQDIGGESHWHHLHSVSLVAGSRIAKAVGSERAAACNSVHHQSIAKLGGGLTLVGQADDGMPEAMEIDDARWVVATQWHPEDTAADDPQQQALFDELVRQAS